MSAPRYAYYGARSEKGCLVWVERLPDAEFPRGRLERTVDPRLDVRSHSPDGFEWGYGGSGPSQLALALAIDVLGGDVETARTLYMGLKWKFVGRILTPAWRIERADLLELLNLVSLEDRGRPLERGETSCP